MFLLFTALFTSITAPSSQLTPIYGADPGSNGDLFWTLSQGRISGIQTWGATGSDGAGSIKVKSWTADSKSQHDIPEFGGDSIVSQCPSFSLSDQQYIDGYRVKYDGYVRYLGFHISDGSTLECAVGGLSNLQDTQWIIYNNSKKQLTGFYGRSMGHLWAIGFQFTDINYTNNTFTTDTYGSSSTFMVYAFEYFRSFDMGRINAVSVWGYMLGAFGMDYNRSVMINEFKGDEMEFAEHSINLHSMDVICDSFTLNENEYINGYRCKYSMNGYDDYVHYVGFRTSFNNIYICDGIGQNDGDKADTGWVMIGNAYLSGLELTIGHGVFASIASIMFQFTYLPSQATNEPTTSNPTISGGSISNPTTSNPTTANPTLYPSKFPTHKPTVNPTHKNTASHDGLSGDDNTNNNSNTYENIFQTKHLLSVFGILCMSLIILFIVICVLCIFMIKFKNTIKTIKSEKAQDNDNHDYDSELQIENANPNSNLNKTDSITDEQKLQNDDEKQYVNNSVPIVNGSDSDSESDSEAEELYGPIAQNDKTKMEIQMSYMFKIEKMKSWFNQKIKLQNEYYELFVDNGYETLELIQLLSEDKLRKIGITKQGHVDKIMMEINSLKKGLASNVQEGINIYDAINTSSKTLMHL